MEKEIEKEYFELLRFESVGADPSKRRESAACASWLSRWLGNIGFAAEIIVPEDGSAPGIVFAERAGAEGAARVLVYGHYDVQPADPVDEWETPPFEPTVKDGRVYCRGAQDDKGQSFAFLCGLRDYLAGVAPGEGLNIKVLLEGQEETGSAFLMKKAPEMRRRLAADVLLVCDTSAANDLRPAIVAGLRGVAHLTVKLEGASRDLHSGVYGGVAPNAAQGMAELLASLHSPSGRRRARSRSRDFSTASSRRPERSSRRRRNHPRTMRSISPTWAASPSEAKRGRRPSSATVSSRRWR